jgi:hypothetical protein
MRTPGPGQPGRIETMLLAVALRLMKTETKRWARVSAYQHTPY